MAPNNSNSPNPNYVRALGLIRANKGISRAEISRITGLSRPAISDVVDALINRYSLVIETGWGPSTGGGGRRPRCLAFNSDSFYIVGLDVGTTHLHGILANLDGKASADLRIPSRCDAGFENVMDRCANLIERLIADSGVPRKKILGIGVGVGGLVNRRTGIVELAPKFGWRDVDVAGHLSKKFDMPILCDYVVRVMALGEKWFGRGAQYDNFICVSLSHGVGAGVVIDGKLLYGADGMCGELGHIVADKDSAVQCKCGKYGCLSALASGFGIAEAARRAFGRGRESSALQALCGGDLESITAEMVLKAAQSGDALAAEVLAKATQYIGIGISILINLFNPQAIFIGGGLAQSGDILFDPIRETVAKHALSHLVKDVQILPVTHGANTPNMGAIALVLSEVLKLNITPQAANSAPARPRYGQAAHAPYRPVQ